MCNILLSKLYVHYFTQKLKLIFKSFIMNNLDIIKIREELGLSQLKFAELIGVDRRTVINYEQGKIIPESKKKLLNLLLQEKRSVSEPLLENNYKEQLENMTREILDLKDHIKTLKELVEEKTTLVVIYKSENVLLKQKIDELERNAGG